MKKSNKGNKQKIKANLILIISFIIILLAFGYSMAKYVIQGNSLHIQSAKEFYFKSSILSENNDEYILSDWNGVDSYNLTIDISNYEDILRYTKEDIFYNFSATSSNENITIVTSPDTTNLTLTGGQNSKQEFNINIIPSKNFAPGEFIIVNVTANSITPYQKAISASYKIYVEEQIAYKTNFEEAPNSEYANLFIETYNMEHNITIQYDNTKAILNTNNDLLQQSQIIQSGTTNNVSISLSKYSNYNIRFIKKDFSSELVFGQDITIIE